MLYKPRSKALTALYLGPFSGLLAMKNLENVLRNASIIDYMFVSLQHSHTEILIPQVMILGDETFDRQLAHKHSPPPPMMGIVLIRRL